MKIQTYEQAGHPIVYIDESGFAHDMPRTYGYAPRGQRCYGLKDWNVKGRTNAIGALLRKTLCAIGLIEGNVDSDVFFAWVEQILLPNIPPNSVIVMDNATFHKRNDTQNVIIRNGHTLEYLPPYSPDLNPIENKWAQAKAIRRRENCSIDSLFTKFLT